MRHISINHDGDIWPIRNITFHNSYSSKHHVFFTDHWYRHGTSVGSKQKRRIMCQRSSGHLGYKDLPEQTALTIDNDGWLHTGNDHISVTVRLECFIAKKTFWWKSYVLTIDCFIWKFGRHVCDLSRKKYVNAIYIRNVDKKHLNLNQVFYHVIGFGVFVLLHPVFMYLSY